MSGRHSGSSRRFSPVVTWSAAALAVVVVAVGGWFGVQAVRASGADSCDSLDTVSLAVDTSIAEPVQQIVSQAGEVDRGCVNFDIRSERPTDTATEIAGTENRPDLWIPDSTLWLLKTLRSTGALPELAKTSVANTLPVLVSKSDAVPVTDTWLSVLQLPGQRIGDPLTSSASNAAILGALAESEVAISDAKAVSAALVPMAQDFGRIADAPHDAPDLVAQVAAEGGTSVATEQALLAYEADNPGGAALTESVPPTGSYFLNYPLAVTAPAGPDYDRVTKAGAALASVLATQSATDTLVAAGFRTASGTPLPDGRGVGSVASLEIKNPLSIETTLRDWAVLALPLRTLVVEDVSGSMAAKSGDSTRIALTVDASLGANDLFSDQTQMGLWAFSIGLGGGKQDYRELVPLGPVSNTFDGKPQRQAILDAVSGLPALVGGGTGLYDTTLAAFRRVKEGYDPNFVNSVIILTDGSNDDEGSIGLDQLLDTLQKEQDPVRPIVIITVGVTSDADPVALQQISAVTGGTSYVAEDPRDIPDVFVKALNSRTERLAGE